MGGRGFSSRELFGAALVSSLFTAILIVGFSTREPDAFKFLFGTIGLLPFAAAVATLAMLFLQNRHGENTLRHGQKAETASRFQKAAEMLTDESAARSLAGMHLLVEIAREDPGRYANACLSLLSALVDDRDSDIKAAAYLTKNEKFRPKRPDAHPSVLFAIKYIDELFPKGQWPIVPVISEDGELSIGSIFIGSHVVVDVNLMRVSIPRFAVFDTEFIRCDFTASVLGVHAINGCLFDRCNMSGVQMEVVDSAGRTVEPEDVELIRFISPTGLDRCKINGISLSAWIKRANAMLAV